MAERRSKARTAVFAGVALVAVAGVVSLLVPVFLQSRWNKGEPVVAAIAALRAYCSAQHAFHSAPRYDDTRRVFANPKDGRGFVDLYRVGGPLPRSDGRDGTELEMIDIAFARAASPETPKAGYWYVDIVADKKDGLFDFTKQCGLCAVPARHGEDGRRTFILREDGAIWSKDNGGKPVTVWPDVEKDGWRAEE